MDLLRRLAESETLLLWGSVVSVVIFVGSLIALPIVVIRLPADYFANGDERKKRNAGTIALAILRNVLGLALLLAGVAMLFLPGQGVLMILASLVVMQFPGKKKLERKLVARRSVLRTLNRIRKKAGKPPLVCGRGAGGGKTGADRSSPPALPDATP